MRLLLGPILLGLALAVSTAEELKLEEAPEPFETSETLDMTMTEKMATSVPESEPQPSGHPEPHPEPEPEPHPHPEPEPQAKPDPEPSAEPTPEPEPAIKFDNVMSEDYGDVVESKNVPDEVDDAAITELVDRFLNTGSTQAKGPAFANGAVHSLINSSDYWKTSDVQPAGSINDPEAVKKWVAGYQVEAQKIMQEVAAAGWKYVANAAQVTKRSLDEAEEALSQFVRSTAAQAKQFDLEAVTDPNIRRQLEFVTFEGMSALSAEQFAEYNKAQAQVNILTTNANVCDKDMPPPCALKKVDLVSIFHTEKDASRLAYLWNNYLTSVSGAKPAYEEIVKYSTKGAQVNGFSDAGAMWRSAFDLSGKNKKPVIDLNMQIEEAYKKIEPFYKALHAYMRRQISGLYENAVDLSKDGPIPAHLFGSLDGGDWSAHFERTKPFDVEDTTPTDMLLTFNTQNYTSKQMFTKAYRYFKSVGFPPLPKAFWTTSIFARVWSKEMICNPPAAIDMRGGNDYRIKACAQLGEPDFQLAHSLLAQTYYQYLYGKNQPFLFREYASPSISDAIAKVFGHLASNPHYLYSQKLVPSTHLDIQDSVVINRLYKEALENVAKIPFNLAADTWRYELFENKITMDKSNDRWWQLRNKYEGIRAPQPYNSSNLDGLIYNTISQIHSPASKDIISYVIQFQILKSICPEGVILSEGCILSEDTTEKLRKTMEMGSSITWLKALEMITGKAEIDAQPLLDYFEPLISWLLNTNEIDQVYVGWDGEGAAFSKDEIPKPRDDSRDNGFVAQDRIALPGGECSHGQECILDSRCNGTICVCNDGLFTLELGGTVSCTADDPSKHGFLHESEGDIDIGIHPAETTPPPETPAPPTRKPHRKGSSIVQLPTVIVLLLTLLFVF